MTTAGWPLCVSVLTVCWAVEVQASIGLRRRAQALDCRHYICLLRQKSVSQILGPPYVFVQAVQYVGKRDQRLHARIPGLLFRRVRQLSSAESRISQEPLLGFYDLKGISRGDQHLREEPVWIKRDGRHQIGQLVRRKGLCFSRL